MYLAVNLAFGLAGLAALCSTAQSQVVEQAFELDLKAQHPIWAKLEGLWIGNYSFYHGDGTFVLEAYKNTSNPYDRGFPYPRDFYHGYINITVQGSRFYQHNYFFNPPANMPGFCGGGQAGQVDVLGDGTCGTHGMERTFEAFGTSTFNNVAGEMAALKGKGTYADYTSVAAPMDDKTLLYTSIMPGVSFHTQTNVAFPDDTHRTRTAYNYNYNADPSAGVLDKSSLYREEKVNYTEFVRHLEWAREHYNTHPSDYIQGGGLPMNTTCLVDYSCPTEIDWCAKGNDPACAPIDINVHVAGTSSASIVELPLSATGAEIRAHIDNTTLVAAGQAYTIWIAAFEVTDTTVLSSQLLPGVNVTVQLTPAVDTSQSDRADRAENTMHVLAQVCVAVVIVVVVLAATFVWQHDKQHRAAARAAAQRLERNKTQVAATLAQRIFGQLSSTESSKKRPRQGSMLMHELETAFKEVNADHSGRITKPEFLSEIRFKLGVGADAISDSDIDLIWASISHGEADITFVGFATFMEQAFDQTNLACVPDSQRPSLAMDTIMGTIDENLKVSMV